ncbi:MAG TPA: uroporphyrinogen-III C-methyltransferase [Chitinophagaceae bacterium]
MKVKRYGKVYFVGAGPGDPQLLTIKAAKILARAEVVITDRLVSEEILKEYVSPNAIIIPAGKQGRSGASTPQFEINDLIVQLASAYSVVVRLKGGDVSLYSNILDELITVKEYNIPYEIIPGITAVSGASAYLGVPLTARKLANGVRILTYYKDSAITDETWKQLASFEDTLVFYMTGNALPQLVGKLLQAGADKNIPFLVVEQATTPNQYVRQFTLGEFSLSDIHDEFLSPSLVIAGKVAMLYKQFAWQPNTNERKPYFKSLDNYPELISLINNIQQLSHVSRA